MTRVDKDGVPCIVQDINFDGTYLSVSVKFFDGTFIYTGAEIVNNLWWDKYGYDMERVEDFFIKLFFTLKERANA